MKYVIRHTGNLKDFSRCIFHSPGEMNKLQQYVALGDESQYSYVSKTCDSVIRNKTCTYE